MKLKPIITSLLEIDILANNLLVDMVEGESELLCGGSGLSGVSSSNSLIHSNFPFRLFGHSKIFFCEVLFSCPSLFMAIL